MAPNDHDVRLKYQVQDSTLTLAEGLEEYYAANAHKILRPRDLPPESAALFRSHDLCHGYLRSIWTAVLAVPRICSAAIEALRMNKRWPWVRPDTFQDRTLADLRREFAIRLV